MAFYKCNVCHDGTNSARSCGRTPCKLEISLCEAHGGDAEAVKQIQEHMRSHDAPTCCGECGRGDEAHRCGGCGLWTCECLNSGGHFASV